MGDQIKILKINVDKNQAVANKFNVEVFPLLYFSKAMKLNGKSGLLEKIYY